MEMMCKNCGKQSGNEFCSYCGQKQNLKITGKYLVRVFFDAFELKRGLLYNFKVLTLNPGEAVSGYLDGKTKPFLNPITFLLISLSVLLLARNFSLESTDLIKDFTFQLKLGIGFILAISVSNFIIFRFRMFTFIEQVTGSIIFTSYLFFVLAILELSIFLIGLGRNDYVYAMVLFLTPSYLIFSFQRVLKRNILLSILRLFTTVLIGSVLFYFFIEGIVPLEDLIIKTFQK